ncbi:MAG: hypothetical protein GYA24_08750 [Candidatus Lokiarchaeota archaeon]|nr:hypothetical protein [Candidatus Lokiarchaeota archaeon]
MHVGLAASRSFSFIPAAREGTGGQGCSSTAPGQARPWRRAPATRVPGIPGRTAARPDVTRWGVHVPAMVMGSRAWIDLANIFRD